MHGIVHIQIALTLSRRSRMHGVPPKGLTNAGLYPLSFIQWISASYSEGNPDIHYPAMKAMVGLGETRRENIE